MEKKKWIIIIAVIIIGILAAYFSLFFYRGCDDISCFNKNLISCSKTKFVKDTEDSIWVYTVIGRQGETCKVNAKLVSVKQGEVSLSNLEGKDMDCYLPLKSDIAPESNIERCHGLLKEALQEQIINNLHSHIIENIGQISDELTKVV